MDMNDFRAWYTLLLILVFIGIAVWAFSHRRKSAFDEAANLPLNEPESPAPTTAHKGDER